METLVQPSARANWRDNYDADELAFGRKLKIFTCLGLPIFVAWYFVLCFLMELFSTMFNHGSRSTDEVEVPLAVVFLRVLLVILAVGALLWHFTMLPPSKDDDSYHARRYIGGYVFLTLQCVTLQAVHQCVTLVACLSGTGDLKRLTSEVSLWLGGVACFVTIQYYTLVHNNPEFSKICAAKMALQPPWNLRRSSGILHVPALCIAVLDILCRQRVEFRACCSLVATIVMTACYVCFYLVIIFVNYRATGYWPYPFLKAFDSVKKWAGFVIVQSVLMFVFSLTLFLLTLLPPIW